VAARAGCAAFVQGEDAEMWLFVGEHPETFDLVYVNGDGLITGTGTLTAAPR
jgi:alkanesulfonate monooxygenase SsuD/methylene tetrahydromethanopterin reductase-like flavin-dependent oxidoreductase (luciferase family)